MIFPRAGRLSLTTVAVLALLGATAFLATQVDAEDAAGGTAYDTPEAAAKALVEAAEKNDDAALLAIFGPAGKELMQSGSDPAVSKERADFAAAAKEKSGLQDNEDGSKTLVVGTDPWPLPFPLVQEDGKWRFDVEAGREELLARRIGENELRAIKLCHIYVEAQVEYASADRDGDGVREYARQVRSTPGKKDGLYWETGEDGDVSPLGPLVASHREHFERRLESDEQGPTGGYYFRVLQGQGGSAPGGRHSYVINGNMIAGFALVAYPAEYRNTGVMSFLISHHGQIFQRDLGPCTTQLVRGMIGFNPNACWTEVTEDTEE